MKKSFFKILLKYLYQYRFILIFFTVFLITFIGVFFAYGVSLEPVLYASTLYLIFGLIFIIMNFVQFYKKHSKLEEIRNNIDVLIYDLPEPQNQIEEDYDNMLKALWQIYTDEYNQSQIKQKESIEYYTTWVHQIKTPISAMRLFLQTEDTEQNALLLTELFRIEQYVEMVLCYFRTDSSSSDFVFKEYSLDDIIRQAVRKYASQFVRKRIRLIYNGTTERIVTDEKWLLFVIEQILSNAIKYTTKGSVTISVNNGIIYISDTGIGIAEEDLPRIFEKGFTGYNGRADKKSTGLGLYLCKRITDKLSNKISVKSEIGKGTTVILQTTTNSAKTKMETANP